MEGQVLSHQRDGDVLVVRMDDGKANALSPAMLEALDGAMAEAEANAKALVLTGRPGRFCAGFDLKIMMSGFEHATALVRQGAKVLMRLYMHPQPVVIACSGHALAGGALVVLCGDHRVGTQGDFRIGLNEVAIGMPLPILAHELARDRLDPRHFTSATLMAEQMSPELAVAAGYLDETAAADAVMDTALAKARQLAELPAQPYKLTKRSIRRRTVDHILATVEDNIREFTIG
ncbi:MAG: crotonase/enoyl-CoA hydratase family protein [Polyangiaceae bacterium]